MMFTYDPDGGDMGRSELKPMTSMELQIVVPHVANILSGLAQMHIGSLPYKYAFEIHRTEWDWARFVIQKTIDDLPNNVQWYEVDGKTLFEIRGVSGGVTSTYICYLVTK